MGGNGLISDRLSPFGTTIFSEMTRLAMEHDAINLSQGFPDFEGPEEIREAAVRALHDGENQYARSQGHPRLVQAISDHQQHCYGLKMDPSSEVVVFSGATEGIAASLLGLVNEGDEVILFEPFYDSYPAGVALAGGVPRFATLRFPHFEIDWDHLESLFHSKTKLLVLNTPHNPTGKVFRKDELERLAGLCQKHDVLVLADEVYEHLVFDGQTHVPMATLPGMWERTLTLSSAGKTFSYTGWKIGWGSGPTALVAAAQSAHQFLTFAVARPLQVGMAHALENLREPYFERFVEEYRDRRDFLVEVLQDVGFQVSIPTGTYFVLVGFKGLFDGSDVEFAKTLIETHGVAAIPPSFFYREHPEEGRRLLRFAFCKKKETLERAAERLQGIRS